MRCVTSLLPRNRFAWSCAPGHPLEHATGLTMQDIVNAGWVSASTRQRAAAPIRHGVFADRPQFAPQNVVNTNNILAISGILLQSDMLAVMPEEVARQYEEFGTLKRLAS